MKKGKKTSTAKISEDKKKNKKKAKKKPAVKPVKKIKARKTVKKKSSQKLTAALKPSVLEDNSDLGVKIAVKEAADSDTQINPPVIEQEKESLDSAVSSEIIGSGVIVADEANQEIEAYEIYENNDTNTEIPLEAEAEINNDYEMAETQNIEDSGSLSDRHKSIIMYIAIVGIMAIVVVFWGLSIKYSLSQSLQNASLSKGEDSEDIKKIKQSLNNVKDDFSIMTDYAKEQLDQALNLDDNPAEQSIEEQIKNEIAAELQKKLNNLNVSGSDGNIIE